MKKIFIIFIALLISLNTAVANEKFEFRYNIHENLPKKWVTEFKNIMDVLQEVLPIQNNMNDYLKSPGMDIYAWKSTKNPFPEVKNNMKDSCICGDGSTRWMQLDIYPQDWTSSRNRIRTYSVIAHEYFHVYQISLSENKLSDRESPKWLTEGGAKVFEEMYVKQYYKKDLLKADIKETKRWSIKKVTKEPHLYEKHKTSNKRGMDDNYTGSAFMLLALVNELKKNNISEEEAFELVFREFWIQRGKNDWPKAFKDTFEMSHDEFYERLSKYKRKDLKKILPSKSLKIQDIFN
jgi:hypothetical protein